MEPYCLQPVYENGKNTTLAYIDKKKINLNVSIKTYMKRLFKKRLRDRDAYFERVGTVLGKKLIQPVFFDRYVKYIPVKCRKTVGREDGSYLYVNPNYILKISDYELILYNDIRIDILQKNAAVNRKLKELKILEEHFSTNVGVDEREEREKLFALTGSRLEGDEFSY